MSTIRNLLPMLIAAVAISQLAFNIFLPSIPGIATSLGATAREVQYTVTLYLVAFAIGQVITGLLSDRFGRKPVLLAGLAVFTASAVICAYATSLEMLIAGRILQALGGCTGLVVARAIIRDLNEQNEAASLLGYITATIIIVPSIAPAIGGYVEELFGWRANFYVLGVIALAILTYTALALPETNVHRTKSFEARSMFAGYAELLKSGPFLGYALCAAFGSAMFFTFASASPHVLINLLGVSPKSFGFYFAFSPVGYMIGNFASGRLAVKYGTGKMILAGNACALLGTGIMFATALAGAFTPLAICAPYFIAALSNGLIIPSATAGAVSVNPKLAGTAAGLIGFLQMGIASVAVWLAGILQGSSQFPMISIILGCAVLAALTSWVSGPARARALKSARAET